MNQSFSDINKPSKETIANFSNEFNLNISALTIFPIFYDCFIQTSPNNIYVAFMKNNNNILEIYKKENNNWIKDGHIKINFDKRIIKGINWSPDSKLILIYGSDINENNSLIIAKNLDDRGYICEIKFLGNINHASFYPDSRNIVYIKSLINILNIFSISDNNNLNTKNNRGNIDKVKYQYLYLKFDDERSINYIKNNNNIFMILPCYGRRLLDKDNKLSTVYPSDYIIILVNKKVFKFFNLKTNDLDRIIPIKNKYSFFITIEKEFYKYPFYIYNLYGEVIFKSIFPKSKLLTNPCLLCNKYHETNFIVVQEPQGKLEILGCNANINLNEIYFYYNYNKLFDDFEKNRYGSGDIKNANNYGNEIKNNNNYNILSKHYNVVRDENCIDKKDILFLEEKRINNNKNLENQNNGIDIEENNLSKKNKKKIELVKVNPFEVDKCSDESDYLLHVEISPNKNYICFVNKKYPKYLFFGYYYQNGVFKIIKFMNNILCFKWSTQQDILLVTFDSPIFYLISKDYYLSYDLEKNYNFNNISWSPLGKEIILSNEEKNIRLFAVLY